MSPPVALLTLPPPLDAQPWSIETPLPLVCRSLSSHLPLSCRLVVALPLVAPPPPCITFCCAAASCFHLPSLTPLFVSAGWLWRCISLLCLPFLMRRRLANGWHGCPAVVQLHNTQFASLNQEGFVVAVNVQTVGVQEFGPNVLPSNYCKLWLLACMLVCALACAPPSRPALMFFGGLTTLYVMRY